MSDANPVVTKDTIAGVPVEELLAVGEAELDKLENLRGSPVQLARKAAQAILDAVYRADAYAGHTGDDNAVYLVGVQIDVSNLGRQLLGIPPRSGIEHRLVRRVSKPPSDPTFAGGGQARNGAATGSTSPGRLDQVRLGNVKLERVEWLWQDRIAMGKLSLLVGDPGMGKSMMTCDLAARVTTGAPWPDGRGNAPRGHVIILTTEDDVADTIAPRIVAAGGDRWQVTVARSVMAGNARRGFDLTADLPLLEDLIDSPHTDAEPGDVKLVIIDPISAYLGGKLNSHRATDVRSALEPLAELAARKRVAILGLSHLTKSGADKNALGRVLGSVAFAAVARVVLFAMRDDEDNKGERRLLLPAKNNLGDDRGGTHLLDQGHDLRGRRRGVRGASCRVGRTDDAASR